MEARHKEVLRLLCPTLVQDMDLTYVFDGLVQRNIFDHADVKDFEADGKSRCKINQRFLNALERRGPNAFPAFIDSLRAHKHGMEIAERLDPASTPQYPAQPEYRPGRVVDNPTGAVSVPQGDDKSEPMDTEPSTSSSPSDDAPPKLRPANSRADLTGVKMRKSPPPPAANDNLDDDKVYQMKSKPCGIAVIINNENFSKLKPRNGTDFDRKKLKDVFEWLGFTTQVRQDQTGEQMKQIFHDFASHDHTSFDCFVLAILSHGVEGAVYGVDEGIVEIDFLTKCFDGGNCPTLAGKPKLFFLQACRGNKIDGGYEATVSKTVAPSDAGVAKDSKSDEKIAPCKTDDSNSIRPILPVYCDMLLAYGTMPGYVAWRNLKHGSWFVQALTEVLWQQADKEDMLSMITMVNNKVARAFESSGRKKQMPAPVTMLCKKLFFNTGR